MLISWNSCGQIADYQGWLVAVRKTLVRWEIARAFAENRQKTRAHRFLKGDDRCPLCSLINEQERPWYCCWNCIVNYTFEITCADSPDMRNIIDPAWVKQHTYKELLVKIGHIIDAIQEMIEVLEEKRERVSRAVYDF